ATPLPQYPARVRRSPAVASRAPARQPPPRRSRPASGPSPPVPRTQRLLRRRGSVPGATGSSRQRRRGTSGTPTTAATSRSRRPPAPRPPAEAAAPPLPLVGSSGEQTLDEPQLRVAADKGCLEAARTPATADRRDHALGAPDRQRLRLSLQLVCARALVGDGGFRRPPRHLAYQDGPRLGEGLDSRGGVDEVARDHSLAVGGAGYRGFARQHPRARA